jgi:hypothetical protein
MAKGNLGVSSLIFLVGTLSLSPTPSLAFDASTDHVCVANCGGDPAPAQGAGSGATLTPPMQQFGIAVGAAVGNAIGRSLSGNRGAAPNRGQNEAASQYLDQWEEDDPGAANAASPSLSNDGAPDHGGLRVVNAPGVGQPDPNTNNSQSAVLQVPNQTTSYVTVSVDGSYGCNTAGGTTCSIPVSKGHHILRAVRTDTGASFTQSVDIPGSGYIWPLSGS